jgi:hypothetical protein
VTGSTPCNLLICINIDVPFGLNHMLSCAEIFFIFFIFGGIFGPIFVLAI